MRKVLALRRLADSSMGETMFWVFAMYPSSGAYDIDAWKNIWIYVELREKI